jgi:hypothetical protein
VRRADTPAMGRPRLELVLELEELPHVRLFAETHEDELRLRRWLSHPASRQRLRDAVADALDELEAA